MLPKPLSLAIACRSGVFKVVASGLPLLTLSRLALGVTDVHFDYTSFESTFGQSQFDVLNYPSINGNYMMTSTDNHRPEMVANNNNLAEFYNWLTDRYTEQTVKNGATAADAINTYTVNNSTNNGPKPTWLILNEISSSLWSANPGAPSISTYRTWLIDCVTRLRDVHGFNVVTLAPFQNPGANDASWQALQQVSYVGVECYLSGTEVWNSGTDYASRLAWAQSQYQASKQSYLNRGVSEDRIFVTEHFASNNVLQDNGDPTGWGRAGLASAADWDTVIQIRQDAILNVGFDGFLAYNWGGNGMGITVAEQIQHEYYYRSRLVMAGQQPQWLSDASPNVNGTVIPLSWSQPLNWIGGVPNLSGAIANFYKTNTTARTITLDGSRTVGMLSFNSSFAYTINPGTGGTLTLNNSGAGATVTVPLGSHTIGVQMILNDNATFNITSTLTLNAGMTSSTARTITKSGNGTLTISGTQSHGAGSILNANAGTTNLNSDGGVNLTVNANSTVSFGATQKIAGLTIATGKTATLTAGGAKVLNVNTLATSGTGKLDLKDNDAVIRSGTLGSWTGSAYTGIQGMVRSGFNNGAWNGSGILTSQAVALTGLTTLGVSTGQAALGLGLSETTTWSGQTINGLAVLVMYTYTGDANLDGMIDGTDYFYIDNGVSTLGADGFGNGDFNYDGIVDATDYFYIDSNIIDQGTPLGSSLALVTVPEPASLLLLTLISIGLTGRRRRTR